MKSNHKKINLIQIRKEVLCFKEKNNLKFKKQYYNNYLSEQNDLTINEFYKYTSKNCKVCYCDISLIDILVKPMGLSYKDFIIEDELQITESKTTNENKYSNIFGIELHKLMRIEAIPCLLSIITLYVFKQNLLSEMLTMMPLFAFVIMLIAMKIKTNWLYEMTIVEAFVFAGYCVIVIVPLLVTKIYSINYYIFANILNIYAAIKIQIKLINGKYKTL